MIDLRELNELTLRVTLALEVRGIELGAEQFKAIVREDNDIYRILKVVGAILFEEERGGSPRRETTRSDGEGTAAATRAAYHAVAQSHQAGTPAPREEADTTPLFALQDRFTMGSVAVARGTRVCLGSATTSTANRAATKAVRRKRWARSARLAPV